MRKFSVATALLCLGSLLSGVEAFAVGYGIEEKVAIEKSITDKVQQIAVPFLGTQEFLVWTDVVVDLPQTENTSKDLTQSGKDADPNWKEPKIVAQDSSMPGIEGEFLPTELQAKMPEELKAALAGRPILRSLTNTMKLPVASIKSVRIRIVVPNTVQDIDNRIKALNDFLTDVVPIKKMNNDSLDITKMGYNRDPVERFIYWKDKLGPTILWAFVAMMGTIFVFGPVRIFMNRLVGTLENFEVKTTSSVKELIEQKETKEKAMIAAAGGPAGLLTGPGGKPEDQPFGYIRADMMPKLLWTLEGADAPTIAVVAAHLAPDLSAQLIAQLPPDKQKEVLLQLSSPQSVDREIVTQLNTQLKAQVESVVGGIDHILNILDQQTPEKQKALLEELRGDKPDVVEQIQGRLLTIDKIFKLPKSALQGVLYEAYKQRITLGVIIKPLSPDLRQTALAALPETLTRVVSDEMSLPSSPAQLDTERRKFMALVRNLEKSGRINFAAKAATA